MKEKIAFVCQRYGLEVNGGAEAECRMYAERLVPYYEVEVLTTCALDYTTWANHYPVGETVLNGVTVRRFPVTRERDMETFNRVSQAVIDPRHTDETEAAWMDAQGPYCLPLVEYLNAHAKDYKAVLFMTYLYYTTARGIMADCQSRILIPTAHDEWPIYQRQFRDVFSKADRLIYNAPAEKEFVEKLFPATKEKPSVTVGAGVTPPKENLPEVSARFGVGSPYICYAGRIDESKGCKKLFDYFIRYKTTHAFPLKLILIGKAVMDIPKHEDIVALGFVPEEEKYAVMKEAQAFAIASDYESLSIVLLESMMMETPVLVNGACAVLRDHCIRSNAGLYFENYEEFEATLDYLLEHKDICRQMGQNGRQYVKENFQWSTIIEKIRGLIERPER